MNRLPMRETPATLDLYGRAHASHEHIFWRQLAPRAALLAGLLETL